MAAAWRLGRMAPRTGSLGGGRAVGGWWAADNPGLACERRRRWACGQGTGGLEEQEGFSVYEGLSQGAGKLVQLVNWIE